MELAISLLSVAAGLWTMIFSYVYKRSGKIGWYWFGRFSYPIVGGMAVMVWSSLLFRLIFFLISTIINFILHH